jgi:aromatic ring-opening dioxygenase catalytic subunit (LigB family)
MSDAPAWPTLYLSHGGGPCFWMDWGGPNPFEKLGEFLRALPGTLHRKPKAVLVISAHWEEDDFTLMTAPKPPMLYDYYGFPEHTYRLQYPASNDAALVARVKALLGAAGLAVKEDPKRGYDHGVFVPLLLVYPEADVPVVQLSMRHSLDPAAHLALGAALAPLRHEDVLIIGSGFSYHNMRFQDADGSSERWNTWLVDAVVNHAGAARDSMLEQWSKAPGARQCHPREEHLLPLMVAAGAAGPDAGSVVYTEKLKLGGVWTSAFQFGAPVP